MVLDINSLNDAVISYYNLDENTGTVAGDSKGSNDGTINGATWTIGKINNALSFDGVDDYVSLYDTSYIQNTGEFTVNVWYKLDDFTEDKLQVIIGSNGVSSNNKGFSMYYDNRNAVGSPQRIVGQVATNIVGSSGNGFAFNINSDNHGNNNWNMITLKGDGVNGYLYINGVEVATAPIETFATGTSYSITSLGAADTSNTFPFNGDIDEPSLFDRALNQDEIDYLYASGSPSSEQQYEFNAFDVSTQAATNIFSDQATLNAEVNNFE